MMTLVGFSFMAMVTEQQGGGSQFIDLMSTRPAQEECGTGSGQGVVELRSQMPYADLDAFDHDRRLAAVPDLFTVDLVTRYVAWKPGRPPQASPWGSRPRWPARRAAPQGTRRRYGECS
jgi:hypothetical protein